MLFFGSGHLQAQKNKQVAQNDSILVSAGYVLILKDTFYASETDTAIFLPKGMQYELKKSPYFKSDKFYDSLRSKASQTELTRKLFSLLFTRSTREITDQKPIKSAEDFFKPFEGKIYGEIKIRSVPILEGNVRDTTKTVGSWYAKTFNKVHINTRSRIIRENLLFKSGERVDAFKVADNERIIRQLRTIRDAKIYLSPNSDNPDVVDVTVVFQDVLSLGANINYSSTSNFDFDIYQRNLLGFARDLQLSYFFNEFDNPQKKHGYGIAYNVPNLWGSFIQGSFLYENNHFREILSANFRRDFFTPEIKYGGGASLINLSAFYEPLDSLGAKIPYSRNEGSIWVGRSYQVMKRTNMIVQSRINLVKYLDRPLTTEEQNRFFTNSNMYFLSMAVVNRTYSKSKLIKGFGRTEDITKGFLASVTYAFNSTEFYNRNYWELRTGYANYFSQLGFTSVMAILGAFKNNSLNRWEDGAFKTEIRYFSPLINRDKYSYRQFIDFEYVSGINRLSENALVVAGRYDNEGELRPLGDRKLNIAVESVLFTPWYFYGCKFTVYNRNTFSWLSYGDLFNKNNYYSSASIGLRLLNESLAFPTIDLSFTFFNSPIGFVDNFQFRVSNNYLSSYREMMVGQPEIVRF